MTTFERRILRLAQEASENGDPTGCKLLIDCAINGSLQPVLDYTNTVLVDRAKAIGRDCD